MVGAMRFGTLDLGDFPIWPALAGYCAIALLVSVLVRNALKHWLARASSRMDPHLHTVLAKTVPRPAGAALFLFAVGFGIRIFPLPQSIEATTHRVLPLLFGTLAILVMMRIALTAMTAYGESNPQLKSTAGIGRAITYVLGFAFIAVMISDALGVSLAPALTALGVGSLSVALALQDTLSNFFAGVYLLLDRPIRPGDFIRLDGGQEGYVETIGWRSTHLRTLAPSTVIVPNATLSKAVITNFRGTNPRLLLSTPIEVDLEEDPDRIGKILDAVIATSGDIPGVDAATKPFVRMGIGDRGLVFTLYVTVLSTGDGGLVQQELRRRAIARLKAEKVSLAEPVPWPKPRG
jgi:small-conductance mechanosensitive channel